ncbi:MAG TPA: hypothetical protein DD490_28315 [Acidobacteria bacterium]|nr:hypothetical protein [Acidobacteriota bacterium]
MPTFADAVQQAEATGQPVVEGFAVETGAGAGAAEVVALLAARFPGFGWTAEEPTEGWLVCRATTAPDPKKPSETPSLGGAWEAVRALKALGAKSAEPLLLTRLASEADARDRFPLWGRVSSDRRREIEAASGAGNRHWPLVQLEVCTAGGQGGAWARWTAKHPGQEPGAGVLVAHPDTGYTRHPRLVAHLATRPGDPQGHHGRNFVERDRPDAATNGLDPLKDRTLGTNPGHGTATASVIAAGHVKPDHPWGVAPGARIIPLRVSSSVIHLSFGNLCDALREAMARGAHVISMSLGGPLSSGLLNALLRRALDEGIIIVSAAGNNAPTVVFPALVPGVLACAASNALAAPWRFSGLGPAVAITAPGELVWHDQAGSEAEMRSEPQDRGSGTSYATAHVAGLAALWLSYHGRDALLAHCKGRKELLPFLFRLCLQKTASSAPHFIRRGEGGFGAGIAHADRLLAVKLPPIAEVKQFRERILAAPVPTIVGFPAASWHNILTLPTLAEGIPQIPDATEAAERERRLVKLLEETVGKQQATGDDYAEIGALAATDRALQAALERAAGSPYATVSARSIRRYLLREGRPLSASLRQKLDAERAAAQALWLASHPDLATLQEKKKEKEEGKDKEAKGAYAIAPPPARRLRAYAFDPSRATRSADAAINEITISVGFERELEPGPVGDYLEVVDVDPASDCAYAPVDLNHPYLLAQDGLPRSEGNPQFHQQMVYAVAMKTIGHFEDALGRPLFWSSVRPWDWRRGDDEIVADDEGYATRFVQRLRLYPHALRESNAYYSPQKRAILFGYFPAGDSDPGAEYPGGVVFTCLSHDIIAHEMTHAILDGMHADFIEPTNPDVLAFHEAFADLVALFQRFTYPDLLRSQIARVRGRLDAGGLLFQLAGQFGAAVGRHQALRDALGHVVIQARRKGEGAWRDRPDPADMDGGGAPRRTLADAARDLSDVEQREMWKRFKADPSLLQEVLEPHDRGSILVAAVFDAYLTIYENRVADLKRIATGGTGVLPDGDLHPDLVGRLAEEAAQTAKHVLRMCLRAMDYVPPLDVTFGDFLRALITADSDLIPDDDRRYRVAFIEAFRKWGIYPLDVRTLSEETLRWSPPRELKDVPLFPDLEESSPDEVGKDRLKAIRKVRRALLRWQPGASREDIFQQLGEAQREIWHFLHSEGLPPAAKHALLGGIDTRRSFQVTNLRPARRIGPRGELLTEMVVEILQSDNALPIDPEERKAEQKRRREASRARKARGDNGEDRFTFRGGVTLIVSLDDFTVRYAIEKRVDSASRLERQRQFRAAGSGGGGAAEYSSDGLPPGWFSDETRREAWLQGRHTDAEDMRASSCACRRRSMKPPSANEPFALLHRG